METRRTWEIVFEVSKDEFEDVLVAHAVGYGIHTQATTFAELRHNLKEAVECHFDDDEERPNVIRLHFVHDEALTI